MNDRYQRAMRVSANALIRLICASCVLWPAVAGAGGPRPELEPLVEDAEDELALDDPWAALPDDEAPDMMVPYVEEAAIEPVRDEPQAVVLRDRVRPERPVDATPPTSPQQPSVTPTPGPAPTPAADAGKRRVLIIGLDGVRPDALQRAKTPTLARLAKEGAVSYDAEAADVTLSGPGWTAMLTGVDTEKHGVRNNHFERKAFDQYPTIFRRLKRSAPTAMAAAFVAWRPIHDHLLPKHSVDRRFWHSSDELVTRAAVKTLTESDPVLTFVHLDGVDRAGHRYGYHPRIWRYRRAISVVDKLVGRIVAAVERRETHADEEWLILVTTDHGGTLTGHRKRTPTDRRIFVIAHGPTVTPGTIEPPPRLTDVSPIALAHLGITASEEWQLDGQVVALREDLQGSRQLDEHLTVERRRGPD